jgi:hypothetical protein
VLPQVTIGTMGTAWNACNRKQFSARDNTPTQRQGAQHALPHAPRPRAQTRPPNTCSNTQTHNTHQLTHTQAPTQAPALGMNSCVAARERKDRERSCLHARDRRTPSGCSPGHNATCAATMSGKGTGAGPHASLGTTTRGCGTRMRVPTKALRRTRKASLRPHCHGIGSDWHHSNTMTVPVLNGERVSPCRACTPPARL